MSGNDVGKEEYLVKTIDWKEKKVRIITQNENGPCPLVAICNVLFLRGDLDIQPADREVVSFEYLVDRLGDYLLNHTPTEDISSHEPTKEDAPKRQGTSEQILTYRHNLDSALSILPNLQRGLDVNVKFDNIHGFESTAELAMFDLFKVNLVHGWIVDPQDSETYHIVTQFGTYNKAIESIIQLDSSNTVQTELTPEQEQKLHESFIVDEFLKDTATQLTYFGLDLLLDSIPRDTLCVLFRNNHFSTLYRHPDLGLYMLVTDSGLVREERIIWESLGDVDQSTSEFFNSAFEKSNNSTQGKSSASDLDYAIAMSIQDEQNRQQREQHRTQTEQSKNKRHSQKKDPCVIA